MTTNTVEKPSSHLEQDLRNAGLKVTLPRVNILKLFLSEQDQHLTAEEVYRQLLSNGIEIGLATIYRVLMQFSQVGLLTRHSFEGDRSVFEINHGVHHDHLVCIKCGKVEEFYDEIIEQRQKQIAEEHGFAVHDHAMYLYVECLKKATGSCSHPEPATINV